MSGTQAGFSLIEALLAMALGLLVLAGSSQVFVSVYQSWQLQGAAQQLQGDARLALKRIAQDIRMAGMFGCLRLLPEDFPDATADAEFARPVIVRGDSLSLIVAELPGHAGAAQWTLLTDCHRQAQVRKGRVVAPAGQMALPISRLEYRLLGAELRQVRAGSSQTLLDHVQALKVVWGDEQRIDLQLDLYEPQWKITQRHTLSVALRNPMALP
ncbi:prepilin-type N-terminal cleavage/methylation domain-containing protein [Pseudomonas sp. RP23018S]|uniref:PilW family protein n=1 Tax=Pseudomonas sp. RP23018S TaxID=3096037 RepID=UPI002ACA0425|nr:prepilin-type N-terminal cleavage/methylation domain-containing protein [Pseudomonas sp. RP23018S]MDZ5603278.1 prepilin-type N-terminal cleavage/methylation domain-containing protein [Pseudomonas sp. RP23018S]